MATKRFDFKTTKGRDKSFKVTFPYPIAGFTFSAELRKERGDTGSPAATFTVTDVDTVAKTLVLTLEDTAIAALTTGVYNYDVLEISDTGFRRSIMEGKVTIEDGVTV